jgi:hypothetical protein
MPTAKAPPPTFAASKNNFELKKTGINNSPSSGHRNKENILYE